MLQWFKTIVAKNKFKEQENKFKEQQYKLKTEYLKKGYLGAGINKNTLKGFIPTPNSPNRDINPNLSMLRARSRDMYMNNSLARGIINSFGSNVIGIGLRAKPQIDHEFLNIDKEQARIWEKDVQRQFKLWSEKNWCDTLKLNNFYEMQQIIQLSWLQSGDVFCLFKHRNNQPYPLNLHLLEADRISTPNSNLINNIFNIAYNPSNNNRIIEGVEIDNTGLIVAYWISNHYADEFYKPIEWKRIKIIGNKTQMNNILHILNSERPEQYRGVPLLSPVIENLHLISQYTNSELTAALLNSFFTVFIKTEDGEHSVLKEYQGNEYSQKEEYINDYKMGSGNIFQMNNNQSIEVAESNRPNVNFTAFVDGLSKQIGTALGLPKELILMEFNSSYSASRAALLEAWKTFRTRREWIQKNFCQPVYERWLYDAVEMGIIDAPGFLNNWAIREAYCQCEWRGQSSGSIDPVKEVKAAVERINNGLSTREAEAQSLTGTDYSNNILQLAEELILANENNISFNQNQNNILNNADFVED